MDARRRERVHDTAAGASRAQCFVDLACPFSYLAVERVHRAFAQVTWRLASNTGVDRRDPASDPTRAARVVASAERRAAELRLPLEWPDVFPR